MLALAIAVQQTVAGLTVIPPSAPEFKSALEQIVKVSPELGAALPYSVLVRNDTGKPVAAMAVLFEAFDEQGRKYQYMNRVVDLHNPAAGFFQPGQVRFEHMQPALRWAVNRGRFAEFRDSQDYSNLLRSIHEYQAMKEIHAFVDFAVFADGTFVGPDVANNYRHLREEEQVRKDFAATIKTFRDDREIRSFLRTRNLPVTKELKEMDMGGRLWNSLVTHTLSAYERTGRLAFDYRPAMEIRK